MDAKNRVPTHTGNWKLETGNFTLINVVGDSLSMPRPDDHISGADLYWVRLQARLGAGYHVIQNSRRRTDSREIRKDIVDRITGYPAKILILHTGIVDCFPRLFDQREHAVLSALQSGGLKFISKAVINYASKRRYERTKHRPRVQVPLAEYQENIQAICDTALANGAGWVVLLGILKTNDEQRARNYNVDAQIQSYDAALQTIASGNKHIHYLDLDAYFETQGIVPILQSDGHHLTKEAHRHIAELLTTLIAGLG